MSFILRFFHHPETRTVEAAAAIIGWLPTPMPGGRERFEAFRTAISEYYPDLCGDEDCADHNLWPEGLPAGPVDDGVVNLLVETDLVDTGVMSVIAREAAGAGLQILDEQNGLLYGPGLEFIGMDDAPACRHAVRAFHHDREPAGHEPGRIAVDDRGCARASAGWRLPTRGRQGLFGTVA
jgi:hypothetical protein